MCFVVINEDEMRSKYCYVLPYICLLHLYIIELLVLFNLVFSANFKLIATLHLKSWGH